MTKGRKDGDMSDMRPPFDYRDHVGMWANELGPWLPRDIYDAHVHLGPAEVMGPISPERRKEALCTFPYFTYQELCDCYRNVYAGKNVAGLIAFPLPFREVNMEAANDYIAELTRAEPQVKGFILSHPTDTARTLAMFKAAEKKGARFAGVKPYFDLLGKSNYVSTMPEFIPDDLLSFMNAEGLVMMLHTSGLGVVDADNQNYLRRISHKYPRVKIILAHMGRYLKKDDYFAFLDTDVLDTCPNLYLETSSATETEVYRRTLARRNLWERLIFGSDMPFGTLTGIEYYSPETGPTFLCRDRYVWSDPKLSERFADKIATLSYNTYHVIKCIKEACAALGLGQADVDYLKTRVFRENAHSLFA